MRCTAMVAMTVLAGIGSNLAEGRSAPTRSIAVCYEGNITGMTAALMTTSRLFRGIGITLSSAKPGSCPVDGIHVSLSRNTPATFQPGALAYALPFEGAHIRIFLDRCEKYNQSLVPHLLGYVIAHEITHIIQGTDHHSENGVMKAHWDGVDFNRIQWDELRFDECDVSLIRLGVGKRARVARPPASAAAPPAVVTAPR